MSVPKHKRNESSVQFLDTAALLHLHTIKQVTKFPKKYTFYVSQPIARLACDVLDNVKRANSIFPSNSHEAQVRRDLFQAARGSVQAMISEINNAKELLPISGAALSEWMSLISYELDLLKRVMESDRKRFSKFDKES